MKQLNLLQPPVSKSLPRLYQVILLLFISSASVVYYVSEQASASRQTKQLVAQTRTQVVATEKAIADSTQALRQRQPISELKTLESTLLSEQASLSGLNSALRAANSSTRAGFANDMTLLAQTAMPGLWLDSLTISYQGSQKTVRLNGQAQQAESLNTYIQRLNAMQLGAQVNVLNLSLNDRDTYRFTLASQLESEQ